MPAPELSPAVLEALAAAGYMAERAYSLRYMPAWRDVTEPERTRRLEEARIVLTTERTDDDFLYPFTDAVLEVARVFGIVPGPAQDSHRDGTL